MLIPAIVAKVFSRTPPSRVREQVTCPRRFVVKCPSRSQSEQRDMLLQRDIFGVVTRQN
jgi:hypothetical protein